MARVSLVSACLLFCMVGCSVEGPRTGAVTTSATADSHPVARLDGLLQQAVKETLVEPEHARLARASWGTVRLDELRAEDGFEEALVARSLSRGDVTSKEAAALSALAVRRRTAIFAPMPTGDGADRSIGVETIVTWLPRVGGLVLALGLLALIERMLSSASKLVRCAFGAVLSAALWVGAHFLDASGHAAGSGALVLGGCLCSGATLEFGWPWKSTRWNHAAWTAGVLGLIWAPLACVLGSNVAAYLAVLALGSALGIEALYADQLLGFRGFRSPASRRRWLLVGLSFVALGHLGLHAGFSAIQVLVRPLWVTGLSALFLGASLPWSWGRVISEPRASTFLLGAASLAWGIHAGQGIFVAAGGGALVVWGLVTLYELFPRKTPAFVLLLTEGSAMVGVTIALERHWPSIATLLSRGV